MKKIVILSPTGPPNISGGVSTASYALYKTLQEQGYAVTFITFDDTTAKGASPTENIIRLYVPSIMRRIINRLARCYFKFVDRHKLTYQTADMLVGQLNARRLQKLLDKLRPQILIVPDRLAPLAFCSVPKGCHVIQVEHHNPARFLDPLLHQQVTSERDITAALWFQKKALRKVHTIICPSAYMVTKFHQTYNFSGNIVCIPNFLDMKALVALAPITVAERLNIPATTPVIYIPSGGSTVKGERYMLSLLQNILAQAPNVAFFISGGINDILAEEIKVGGLVGKVYTPGVLPFHENLSLAASCTVCVSPCLAESYGMALAEALAMGMPTFAFDVGGNRDVILDGCGMLTPHLNIPALASAAAKAIQTNSKNYLPREMIQSLIASKQQKAKLALIALIENI